MKLFFFFCLSTLQLWSIFFNKHLYCNVIYTEQNVHIKSVLNEIITKRTHLCNHCHRQGKTLTWHFKSFSVVLPSLYPHLFLKGDHYLDSLSFKDRTALVVEWLRIPLTMQGTQVWSQVQEDPAWPRTTKPVICNHWALEPESYNYWTCVLQLIKPTCPEPMLPDKKSHYDEKPVHRNWE